MIDLREIEIRTYGCMLEQKAAPTLSADEGTYAHAFAAEILADPEWERWLRPLAQQSHALQPHEFVQPAPAPVIQHAPPPRAHKAQWKREQRA